jgi:Uma2 family endonuclease
MPESKLHLKIRTLLFSILETFREHVTIGSDQFIYWNAADPSRCVAPDAFVRLGAPDSIFTSWKTWERGAPELAVEVVSDSDEPETSLDEKLRRYHELGVQELIRFDPNAPEGERLRAWSRVEGDLVERVVENDRTPCFPLNLFWVVVPAAGCPAALRLAQDEEGLDLVLTDAESEKARAESEKARAESEKARAASEAEAREAEKARADAAERRLAELEARLAQQGGP